MAARPFGITDDPFTVCPLGRVGLPDRAAALAAAAAFCCMALIAPTAVSLLWIDCRAKVAVMAAEAAPAFWRLDAEPRPPD